GADRMAERDGTAIDVQAVFIDLAERPIEPELLAAVPLVFPGGEAAEHLRRERLVDLPVVEIVEAEPMALEDRRRRMHGSEPHLRRIEPRPFRVDDAPQWLEVVLAQRLFRGEQQPRRAIGNLRAVPGSDVAVLAVEE